MADNDNKGFDTDMLNKMLGDANKRMETMMGMLPQSEPKRVAIKGKKANATLLKDGRVLIEFDTKGDSKAFFNSLK